MSGVEYNSTAPATGASCLGGLNGGELAGAAGLVDAARPGHPEAGGEARRMGTLAAHLAEAGCEGVAPTVALNLTRRAVIGERLQSDNAPVAPNKRDAARRNTSSAWRGSCVRLNNESRRAPAKSSTMTSVRERGGIINYNAR